MKMFTLEITSLAAARSSTIKQSELYFLYFKVFNQNVHYTDKSVFAKQQIGSRRIHVLKLDKLFNLCFIQLDFKVAMLLLSTNDTDATPLKPNMETIN